eukprot:m.465231 g.465231  ORF g.465231 m.465231 type:complete len:50 (-) comp24048_c0_seq1:521-670(-)
MVTGWWADALKVLRKVVDVGIQHGVQLDECFDVCTTMPCVPLPYSVHRR